MSAHQVGIPESRDCSFLLFSPTGPSTWLAQKAVSVDLALLQRIRSLTFDMPLCSEPPTEGWSGPRRAQGTAHMEFLPVGPLLGLPVLMGPCLGV